LKHNPITHLLAKPKTFFASKLYHQQWIDQRIFANRL
jgi:hypothetical protein